MVAAGTSALTIDTTGLRAFARSLRYVSVEAYAELRASMQEVGERVAEEARRITESDQARPTIKAKVSGVNVQVTASTTIGRLQERGNKGGGSAATKGVFRHPTGYRGTGPWVEQPMHPFLSVALANKREEMVVKITEDLDALAQRMLSGVFDEGMRI